MHRDTPPLNLDSGPVHHKINFDAKEVNNWVCYSMLA